VAAFLGDRQARQPWDVFHLAYMMYVPGLSLHPTDTDNSDHTDTKNSDDAAAATSATPRAAGSRKRSVVRMRADAQASVGTSAYVISRSGVDAFLAHHAAHGYTEAVPNVMATLFPATRFAAYPMPLHRAAGVGSLVNPQMDDFRKIMFAPAMVGVWERLMVATGLQNNQLFPGLVVGLLSVALAGVGVGVVGLGASAGSAGDGGQAFSVAQVLVLAPLAVALWGAALFTTNRGGCVRACGGGRLVAGLLCLTSFPTSSCSHFILRHWLRLA
jgi:hypothetical protein